MNIAEAIFKTEHQKSFLFSHLRNEMRHFTINVFCSELQGVFSVSDPALNCKAQGLGQVSGGQGTQGQIAKLNVSSSLGQTLCLSGVYVLGSRREGRREEVRTTWKEE